MTAIKMIFTIFSAILCLNCLGAWKPAGERIKTVWAEKIDVKNVLPEYPRPLLERSEWINLNGLWKFAVANKKSGEVPIFNSEILVPFSMGSSLSGLGIGMVKHKNYVYERGFSIPQNWLGKRVILNFGAVYWEAEVFVNGKMQGSHQGGFTPFSFDITDSLKSGENTLRVVVSNPYDDRVSHGKVSTIPIDDSRPSPFSAGGIWQTVWLEPVEKIYIKNIVIGSDIDSSILKFKVDSSSSNAKTEIKVFDDDKLLACSSANVGEFIEVKLDSPKLWSPDSPFLYRVEVSLSAEGKLVDRAKSYAAMRKISTSKKNGVTKIFINNKQLYQFGLLDHGVWSDGAMTAPTDEALKFDIEMTKRWGFNMIRKHVKIEPARWYYHCDKLGVLVWQDMPHAYSPWSAESAQKLKDKKAKIWYGAKIIQADSLERTARSEQMYRKELKEMIDALYSQPCIVVWVPFNEGWGQFKTKQIADWTKAYDPSRLVNAASGGNILPDAGDILDGHGYTRPSFGAVDVNRAQVSGEFGGIMYIVEGHVFDPSGKNHGYGKDKQGNPLSPKSREEFFSYLKPCIEELFPLIKRGSCAAVYTQTSDSGREVNGLMSIDRKFMKVDESEMSALVKSVIKFGSEN